MLRKGQLREVTTDDGDVQALKHLMPIDGHVADMVYTPNLGPFWTIKDQLHLADGLVFMGGRIIILKHCRPRC